MLDAMDREKQRRFASAALLLLLGIAGSVVVQNGWPLFATLLGAIVTVGSRSMPNGRRAEKRYEVCSGNAVFQNLSAAEALAKLREHIAQGANPFLYDEFGDAMGLVELEEVIATSGGSSGEKRPTDA